MIDLFLVFTFSLHKIAVIVPHSDTGQPRFLDVIEALFGLRLLFSFVGSHFVLLFFVSHL